LEEFDLNSFLIVTNQVSDLIDFGVSSTSLLNLKSSNTLKHLFDMREDWIWILGLTNDFQKIIIGQEIESWELSSLGFQELVQVLLNLFKLLVEVIKKVKEALNNQTLLTVLHFVDSLHLSLEDLIVSLENGIFIRELLGDIWLSFEDGLEILPFALDLHQDFEGLSDLRNGAFPMIDLCIELLVEW